MTIKKFQGKTKEEAIAKAKSELGVNAVVMNVKEIKPKGMLKVFKDSTYEVTAAVEEKEQFSSAMTNNAPQKPADSINLAADEQIKIPQVQREKVEMPEKRQVKSVMPEKTMTQREQANIGLEERLASLSNILEKQLGVEEKAEKKEIKEEASQAGSEGFGFIKMLYRTLLDNEVDEKYVNQIMDEIEKVMHSGNSVDYILSSVYQKMILKLGQPSTIETNGKKPRVIFFIGPTGVGKTTTIAKIASKYKVEHGKNVAFLSADTYRIAATEQLRTYANILDAPMNIIYSADDLNEMVSKVSNYDLVFVDTAGFSHKNAKQCEDMKNLIAGLDASYQKEVYLVLSATTKYRDLLDIVDIYKQIAEYKLVFTKLDETTCYGNIMNIKLYSDAPLSYVAIGQNVPDDIEIFNTQKIVKKLLSGRK